MAPINKLAGHIGHLSPDQEAKLLEFWAIIFTSVASVLSAVYEVPIPDGRPSKLFETLDKINEPTVDAITSALKGTTIHESNGAPFQGNGDTNSHTNGEPNGEEPGINPHRSLDKIESLMNEDAKTTLMSEMANRKVKPEHFASLFADLRRLGVQESEIKSMENILSQMTPQEMCFAILKMVKQEHPDSLLLRFLRARKWDIGKAFSMMASTILWRKQLEVDGEILPHGEEYALEKSRGKSASAKEKKDGADFIEQLEMGKSFLHGFDREGRPVNYVRVKIHKPGAQSEETLERYIVHVIESTRLIIAPPVETGTIVFDMTGFGLSNMEYAPVKFIIKCFEANYPESLGLLLIHNAPWVFSGIWRLIQGWMDPVVASKVQFTRFMYDRMMVGIRMLAATAAWISATTLNDGKEETSKVEELKSRRNGVIEEFRANYWKLDPYIRARALIDRDGMLLPGGVLSRDVVNGQTR